MKNSMQPARAAGKTIGRGLVFAFAVTTALLSSSVLAQQQGTSDSDEMTAAALSIAKMMDPNTWATMMTMAMDPRIWTNPISSCAACHDNEDVGRYQQVFGPYTSMMNPAMWSTPDAYNEMMSSMFDPKAAEQWARAVEKKYGLKPGETAPTMHAWWPMAPTMPMPAPVPAQ